MSDIAEYDLCSRPDYAKHVAMRQPSGEGEGTAVSYLYGDHLGSISLITDASGAAVTETLYPLTRAGQPYGQLYWQWGATRCS